MKLSRSILLFSILATLLSGLTLYAAMPPIVSAHNCIVPASGPWPPCATSGHLQTTSVNNTGACVIPASGRWPACSRGNNTNTQPVTATTSVPVPVFERELGFVEEVVDGHTIIVNIDGGLYTVRLLGLTTPEIDEPCGAEASGQLSSKVGSQWVELERDVTDQDQFTHLLRYVHIRDRMINAEMVREGYAAAQNEHPDVKHAGLLYQLQTAARASQHGCLWEWSSPIR